MERSRIGDFLFGIPDRPLSRSERIEIIKHRIQNEEFVTPERLDQALEHMLDEIQESGDQE